MKTKILFGGTFLQNLMAFVLLIIPIFMLAYAAPALADTFWQGNTSTNISNVNIGFVGIGTASPGAKLTVSNNTSGYPSPITATAAHLVGADSANSILLFDSFAGSPMLLGRRANGTAGTPSATLNDNVLVQLQGRGFGTAYTTGRADIYMAASENWTNSAQGTYMVFRTTPNGSTTVAERIRINNAGNVGIGTSTPTQALDVVGNIKLSGNILSNGDICIGTCE